MSNDLLPCVPHHIHGYKCACSDSKQKYGLPNSSDQIPLKIHGLQCVVKPNALSNTLADSGFFKIFLYRGGVKSTVSWVFEDLKFKISEGTEDGSTEALLQILHGQYLILGVFGSCMF